MSPLVLLSLFVSWSDFVIVEDEEEEEVEVEEEEEEEDVEEVVDEKEVVVPEVGALSLASGVELGNWGLLSSGCWSLGKSSGCLLFSSSCCCCWCCSSCCWCCSCCC